MASLTYANQVQNIDFDLELAGDVNIRWIDPLGHSNTLYGASLQAGSHSIKLERPSGGPGYMVMDAAGKRSLLRSTGGQNSVRLPKVQSSALGAVPAWTELTSVTTNSIRFFPNSALPLDFWSSAFADQLTVLDLNQDGSQDLLFTGENFGGYLSHRGGVNVLDPYSHGGLVGFIVSGGELSEPACFYDKDHSGPEVSGLDFSQLGNLLTTTDEKMRIVNSAYCYEEPQSGSAQYFKRTTKVIQNAQLLGVSGGMTQLLISLGNYVRFVENGSVMTACGYPKFSGVMSNYIISIDANGIIQKIQNKGYTDLWDASTSKFTRQATNVQEMYLDGISVDDKYLKIQSVTADANPDYLMGWASNSQLSSAIPQLVVCQQPGLGCAMSFGILSYGMDGYSDYIKKYLDGKSAIDLLGQNYGNWTNSADKILFASASFSNTKPLIIQPVGSLGDVDGDGVEDFLSYRSLGASGADRGVPMVFSLKKLDYGEAVPLHPYHSIGYLSKSSTSVSLFSNSDHYQILGDMDANGKPEFAVWSPSVSMDEESGFDVYEINKPINGIYPTTMVASYKLMNNNFPLVKSGSNQPQFIRVANGKIVVGIRGNLGTRVFNLERTWAGSQASIVYDIGTSGWLKEYGVRTSTTINTVQEPMEMRGGYPYIPVTNSALVEGQQWLTTSDPYFTKITTLSTALNDAGFNSKLEVALIPGAFANGVDCGKDYCGNVQLFMTIPGKLWRYQVGQIELSGLVTGATKVYSLPLNQVTREALAAGSAVAGSGLQIFVKPSLTSLPLQIAGVKLVKDQNLLIDNNLPTLNCSGTSNWVSGGPGGLGYGEGALVKAKDYTSTLSPQPNAVFKCLPYPNSGWCANPGYQPGTTVETWQSSGFYVWQEAWEKVGVCLQ